MVFGVWDGNGLDTMYDTRIGYGVMRCIDEPDMLVWSDKNGTWRQREGTQKVVYLSHFQ